NKKYFRDVGLDPEEDYPKTWEEMMEVSEKRITCRKNSREPGFTLPPTGDTKKRSSFGWKNGGS
ncbi:MAG: hypothetical protein R6U50_12350, partial [Desulfobacterales bacterium]